LKKQDTIVLIGFSVAGGIISALAWYPFYPGIVLLFSLVPFFILANHTDGSNERYGKRLLFIRVLPGFLAMNITALAWVRIAGIPLLITAIAGNTLIMAITFWTGWLISNRPGRKYGSIFIIICWLAMEYATNNIDIFSPWLNLGNGFAGEPGIIQWYEITGVSGGTAWILLSNAMLAEALTAMMSDKCKTLIINRLILFLITIALPPVLSLFMTPGTDKTDQSKAEILIVQPCSDPYEKKFTTPFIQQLEEVLEMAEPGINNLTSWIITPETTIDDPISLDSLNNNRYITEIRKFLSGYPQAVFVLGATTLDQPPRKELHNSALMIPCEGKITWYHKSKLVPGIEKSFRGNFSLLQKIFPYLGGTDGGFTGQKSPSLLTHPSDGGSAAPVICFESAFGGHVAGFLREGAQFLVVMTNDGWWKGTAGYSQHLAFSSLRAIETRRYVARAANTGVSAIIAPDGKIIARLPWWEKGTISQTITLSDRVTIYARYGDIIGRMALTVAIFMILIRFVAIPLRKRYSHFNQSGMQP
jgi:apolipoprotein N-acyltransferase